MHELSNKDMNKITEKLDELLEYACRHDEHLKNLNGTVVKHEKQFLDLYKKTDNNTNHVNQAYGGIKIFGVIITIITLFSLIINFSI